MRDRVYEVREALAQALGSQAGWRAEKVEQYPGDEGNASCAAALAAAATYVRDLPGSDARLRQLAAVVDPWWERVGVVMFGEKSGRIAGRFGFDRGVGPGDCSEFLDELVSALTHEQVAAEVDNDLGVNDAMTKGTRIIGYVPVSTDEQGRSDAGRETQRAAILAEAERRGWIVVRIAEDVRSGKSRNGRHGLDEAIASIERGEADALVAAKLDRLSRSVLDFLDLADRAQRMGWALVVLDRQLDMTTPNGKLLANILASFAEHERDIIASRTREGLAAKRAAGTLRGPIGRPTWLQVPPDVRRRIVNMSLEGMTQSAIARKLTEEGVPTAAGGERWHQSTVRQVLLASQRGRVDLPG